MPQTICTWGVSGGVEGPGRRGEGPLVILVYTNKPPAPLPPPIQWYN